jgi:colanic acid/amylovoran biosynthesis glycosyltransferase
MKIAYLIPEFPGQTHVFIWREITHLRQWGLTLALFSTRRPSADTRARHSFAGEAERETFYLWPASPMKIAAALGWAIARHPIAFIRAAWLAATLPVDRSALPLLIPACIMARQCAMLKIDRLHSHMPASSTVVCMIVSRLLGIPYSMTLHGNLDLWGGAMGQKFAGADFTIVVAQWLLDRIHREFPHLPASRFTLASMGVDTQRWTAPPRPPCPPRSGLTILTVARLNFAKGHDLLLHALKILADQNSPATLHIAGAGKEDQNLRALAQELGISNRVAFLDSISEDQVIEEMKSADLFVLATRDEAIGVAYMEAMAMALPTIGTNVGGVGELITSAQDGILVPPDDPPALAAAIADLAADPRRREQLGQSARETVRRRFDSRIGAAAIYHRFTGHEPPSTDP